MPEKSEKPTTIVDIDWQIGVVSASSVSDMKGKTYLQLKWFLERDAEPVDPLLTELDIATFYKLFHALKQTAVALDDFL